MVYVFFVGQLFAANGAILIILVVNSLLCDVAGVGDAKRIGAEYTMIQVAVIVPDTRVARLCWRSHHEPVMPYFIAEFMATAL